MAHRSIGQERFGFAGCTRSGSSLDDLAVLIAWEPVAILLDPLYSATKGEPAWPPLAMFKALLLSIWYDLSDVKLVEACPFAFVLRQVLQSTQRPSHLEVIKSGSSGVPAVELRESHEYAPPTASSAWSIARHTPSITPDHRPRTVHGKRQPPDLRAAPMTCHNARRRERLSS
ncbi:MAG: transposase [Stellaceae bacterium]